MSCSFNPYLNKVCVNRSLDHPLLVGKKGLYRRLHYVLNSSKKFIRVGVYMQPS
jgi:hypothetical protein